MGKLILLCLGVFLSLAFAELLLRGVEYYQYIKPENRILGEQLRKIYSDERNKDYIFGHKPNIKIRLQKGYYNFTFITNSDGLREEKDYAYLEKSIIFLGDSIVEGASVENKETMSKIFENRTGIATLNFGLGSANTANEYYWLKSKYKKIYNTKLIALVFCLNDFPQNTFLRYFDVKKGNWRFYRYLVLPRNETIDIYNILKKLENVSILYTLIKLRNVTFATTKLPVNYKDISQESKTLTALYINKIKYFAQSIGSQFIVVIFPTKEQLTKTFGVARRAQDVLIEILQKNSIPYIDLYDVMKKNYFAHPEVRWYYDEQHPYKEGHKLIGEYLAIELRKIFPDIFQG